MKSNIETPRRNSLRLQEYDYSKNGYYFVTIVVKNRLMLFGYVEDRKMILNDAGKMIDNIWNNLPEYYLGIKIDCGVVMPNHLHGVIFINHNQNNKDYEALSLPEVMERLKSYTTNQYIVGVRNFHWEPFQEKLWQPGYFDIIIKDEKELNWLRNYIKENPEKWDADEEKRKKNSNYNYTKIMGDHGESPLLNIREI